MIVRFRVSTSLGNYFGASPLSTVELDRLPEIGDAYDDEHGSFLVVEVLDDVDPERGSHQRGAIAFVMRLGADPLAARAPRSAAVALSCLRSTAYGMRECIERANVARRRGNREAYRRHVEEFLFLSSSISRTIGSSSRVARASGIPYLPVYSEGEGLITLMREGFIESRFAAQVESIRSLDALALALERMDGSRPTMFIVAEMIGLRSGLDALHLIRAHPKSADALILVLTQQEGPSAKAAAMEAGADAYARFPDHLDDYVSLVERIRDLMNPGDAGGLRSHHEA